MVISKADKALREKTRRDKIRGHPARSYKVICKHGIQPKSSCKKCNNEDNKQRRLKNPPDLETRIKQAKNTRLLNRKKRVKVIKYYGNNQIVCVRCGFKDMRALSLDHKNGNGNKHRKSLGLGSGSEFYNWIIKNNYPDGYQVLCMNCQFIKASEMQERSNKNYWEIQKKISVKKQANNKVN